MKYYPECVRVYKAGSVLEKHKPRIVRVVFTLCGSSWWEDECPIDSQKLFHFTKSVTLSTLFSHKSPR